MRSSGYFFLGGGGQFGECNHLSGVLAIPYGSYTNSSLKHDKHNKVLGLWSGMTTQELFVLVNIHFQGISAHLDFVRCFKIEEWLDNS